MKKIMTIFAALVMFGCNNFKNEQVLTPEQALIALTEYVQFEGCQYELTINATEAEHMGILEVDYTSITENLLNVNEQLREALGRGIPVVHDGAIYSSGEDGAVVAVTQDNCVESETRADASTFVLRRRIRLDENTVYPWVTFSGPEKAHILCNVYGEGAWILVLYANDQEKVFTGIGSQSISHTFTDQDAMNTGWGVRVENRNGVSWATIDIKTVGFIVKPKEFPNWIFDVDIYRQSALLRMTYGGPNAPRGKQRMIELWDSDYSRVIYSVIQSGEQRTVSLRGNGYGGMFLPAKLQVYDVTPRYDFHTPLTKENYTECEITIFDQVLD